VVQGDGQSLFAPAAKISVLGQEEHADRVLPRRRKDEAA
jgi:hypothetical protein